MKQALIAVRPDVFFTTSHFDGYPAVLVALEQLDLPDLEELVTDAWLARAPKRLRAGQHPDGTDGQTSSPSR